MQALPIRYGDVKVGDHLLTEIFYDRSHPQTTRLFVGGESVRTRGFRVMEVVKLTRVGDDTTLYFSKEGEVTSSDGNQTLKVTL
jgi:hypothetical protein